MRPSVASAHSVLASACGLKLPSCGSAASSRADTKAPSPVRPSVASAQSVLAKSCGLKLPSCGSTASSRADTKAPSPARPSVASAHSALDSSCAFASLSLSPLCSSDNMAPTRAAASALDASRTRPPTSLAVAHSTLHRARAPAVLITSGAKNQRASDDHRRRAAAGSLSASGSLGNRLSAAERGIKSTAAGSAPCSTASSSATLPQVLMALLMGSTAASPLSTRSARSALRMAGGQLLRPCLPPTPSASRKLMRQNRLLAPPALPRC